MRTRVEDAEIPHIDWDSEEERALTQRLIAAGFRMPTKSLDRPRVMPRRRPRWKAFLITLWQWIH